MISRTVSSTFNRILLLRNAAVKRMGLSIAGSQRLLSSYGPNHPDLAHMPHDADVIDPKYYPEGMHPPTYDEHIVPEGDWYTNNAELQKKYNKQLFLGVLFFLITVYNVYHRLDWNQPPRSIGVNPPKFSVYPPNWKKGPDGKWGPVDEAKDKK